MMSIFKRENLTKAFVLRIFKKKIQHDYMFLCCILLEKTTFQRWIGIVHHLLTRQSNCSMYVLRFELGVEAQIFSQRKLITIERSKKNISSTKFTIAIHIEQRVRLNDIERNELEKMDTIGDSKKRSSVHKDVWYQTIFMLVWNHLLPSNAIFRCTCRQFPIIYFL